MAMAMMAVAESTEDFQNRASPVPRYFAGAPLLEMFPGGSAHRQPDPRRRCAVLRRPVRHHRGRRPGRLPEVEVFAKGVQTALRSLAEAELVAS